MDEHCIDPWLDWVGALPGAEQLAFIGSRFVGIESGNYDILLQHHMDSEREIIASLLASGFSKPRLLADDLPLVSVLDAQGISILITCNYQNFSNLVCASEICKWLEVRDKTKRIQISQSLYKRSTVIKGLDATYTARVSATGYSS